MSTPSTAAVRQGLNQTNVRELRSALAEVHMNHQGERLFGLVPSLILMARVFSDLCVTPKASESDSKVCKDCLQAVAVASAFAKIRLFDKQINLELEGALEFAQLSSLDLKKKKKNRRGNCSSERTQESLKDHSDLRVSEPR